MSSIVNSVLATTSNHIITPQMLYEAGIHDNTESMYVSGLVSASYTIVIGSGGIFPAHSHIPVLLNRGDIKNIIFNHIGHDYEPYFRFSFSLEDTLFHNHAAQHIYFCMDDDVGGVALYSMDMRDYQYGTLSSPQTCHRTIDVLGHSHTITLVRHASPADPVDPADPADPTDDQSITASGADPTTP